jgi:hypothetical protein
LEPEYSLLPPQNPTICHYPVPDQSGPFLPSHFLMIHLNINVPFTPRSSKWFLSLRFPQRTLHLTKNQCKPGALCSVSKYGNYLCWEVVSISNKSEVGKPPLVGCMLLLIQYIAAALHIGGVFSSGTWGRAMSWWQGPLITDLQALQFQQTGVSGKFPGRMCANRHRHNAEEELQSTGLVFLWIKQ